MGAGRQGIDVRRADVLLHRLHAVVSRNSITTECADVQSVGRPVLGRFRIVLRVFGRSDSANGRDQTDGGGLAGWISRQQEGSEPPGIGKQDHRAGVRIGRRRGGGLPRAAWRIASLLPGRGMKPTIPKFGYYGVQVRPGTRSGGSGSVPIPAKPVEGLHPAVPRPPAQLRRGGGLPVRGAGAGARGEAGPLLPPAGNAVEVGPVAGVGKWEQGDAEMARKVFSMMGLPSCHGLRSRRIAGILAAVIVGCLGPGSVVAGDWPMWRYDAARGGIDAPCIARLDGVALVAGSAAGPDRLAEDPGASCSSMPFRSRS